MQSVTANGKEPPWYQEIVERIGATHADLIPVLRAITDKYGYIPSQQWKNGGIDEPSTKRSILLPLLQDAVNSTAW